MKINELRVGNLLYNESVIVTIDARTIFDIWDNKGLSKYKPIPITDTWLLKFGFKFSKGLMTYYKNNHDVSLYASGIIEFSPFGHAYNVINIKYIHELQNIYFALTGDELQCSQ
jgi:hypothetical protein